MAKGREKYRLDMYYEQINITSFVHYKFDIHP